MRAQLKKVAAAAQVIEPLRVARDRLFPEVSEARARIAALEADNRRLLEASGSGDESKSYADVRDAMDNERIGMILACTLASDSNCIDVGCHEGGILADMLRIAPQGRHLAFEPIPHMCDALRARFPQAEIRQSALSDRNGEATFKHVTDLPGYSGLRERSYPRAVNVETITVKTERLDDVVPAGWKPDLMKIDVEGAEQLVIEGGLETIRTHRPTLIFEFGPGASNHYGTGPQQIHRLLCEEAGMRIYDLDGGGAYSLAQLEEEYAKGERWQWVAHR